MSRVMKCPSSLLLSPTTHLLVHQPDPATHKSAQVQAPSTLFPVAVCTTSPLQPIPDLPANLRETEARAAQPTTPYCWCQRNSPFSNSTSAFYRQNCLKKTKQCDVILKASNTHRGLDFLSVQHMWGVHRNRLETQRHSEAPPSRIAPTLIKLCWQQGLDPSALGKQSLCQTTILDPVCAILTEHEQRLTLITSLPFPAQTACQRERRETHRSTSAVLFLSAQKPLNEKH